MPTRILREGIITSVQVNALSGKSELFYRRLMSVVDDYGRYFAHPAILRAACYPLQLESVSEADVQQMLSECTANALLVLYNDEKHLFVVKFGQQIRGKSKFPEPSQNELLSNCTSNAKQMRSESESESESYAYTEYAYTEKAHTKANGSVVQELKARLGEAYRRKHLVWGDVERDLIELSRRPNIAEELDEILAYRKLQPKFCPRSVERLVQNWDKTLDESRNEVDQAPQRNCI